MAGALYIWIVLAVFIGVVGVMVLLTGLFWIGHWFEKKKTGAAHGFLEVPPGLNHAPPRDQQICLTVILKPRD